MIPLPRDQDQGIDQLQMAGASWTPDRADEGPRTPPPHPLTSSALLTTSHTTSKWQLWEHEGMEMSV